ncbi:hypothetical protein Drorol1_Dr00000433 [Drosera rotundifolia]
MEEEDEKDFIEMRAEDLGLYGNKEEVSSSPHNESSSINWDEGGNRTLNSEISEDGQFEQVSLKDHEKNGGEFHDHEPPGRLSDSSSAMHISSGTDLVSGRLLTEVDQPSSIDDELLHQSASSPGLDTQPISTRKSFSSDGIDMHREPVYSPVDSPPRSKPKAVMPSVSPELLHLIDSAIMGKPESLGKLRSIVNGVESFGHDVDSDGIAFLVVDSLLATMGGVESFEDDEDNNPPSVMLNSRAAIVSGELIPWLPCVGDSLGLMSARTRMVRGLLAILRACTRNRAMCSTAGLLQALLGSYEKIFSQDVNSASQVKWDGTPLCLCIQYLAGHSISVIDLHRWFLVMTRTLTTEWALPLMIALEKAVVGKESRGPASTFEFDGESSGLLGPGESRWPFSNGYAFATWIYVESFADTLNTATAAAAIAAAAAATSGKTSPMSAAAAASALAGEGTAHMPRLFSFLSADNQGVEAYFHAQFLVVESGSGRGKKASFHFTHAFKPQCWYFIGLEHTCKQNLIGKGESELRLYIDGSLYESRPFEFPRISKPLAFCCIGTNPPPTMAGLQRRRRQCPLFAEMGPIYIFKDPIGPEKMARLAARGGDVIPSFGTGAGLPWMATSDYIQRLAEESSLLDSEIAGCIHLLYHPKLLGGRFCPDVSPTGAAGTLRRPAEVLGQVHVATRMRPVEALWALAYGGPMSLLPLAVSHMKNDDLEPEQGNLSLSLAATRLAAPIFRIIAMAIQHPGSNEDLSRVRGPEVLSRILNYLLQTLSSLDEKNRDGVGDEELVAAVVSLCQAQKHDHALKVQLFSTLLLDLKIWSLCNYGLQKKLLSSLADMVFTESSVMRDANAIQMLLDGCRRCYWTIREKDSVNTFSLNGVTPPVGEVNALVEELLVVIELLIVAAPPSLALDDMRCLLGFMVDCPQPNQVSRVMHLIYRLVVQPKASRAQTFAEAFISCGGVEALLVLLQRIAKEADQGISATSIETDDVCLSVAESKLTAESGVTDQVEDVDPMSVEQQNLSATGTVSQSEPSSSRNSTDIQRLIFGSDFISMTDGMPMERMASASENFFVKNVGGINLSISAFSARNNVYNIDKSDGLVVGIIKLIGTLVASGYLKFGSTAAPDVAGSLFGSGLHGSGGSMFDDKVALLLFALQKAFQAAPRRLMTRNVYIALLGASINATSTDDGLNLYDSGHRFEHLQLLLVLLRSLPYASMRLQRRVLQDLLFLACSHPENRSILTKMDEWPEWILEVLISNYERGADKGSNCSSFRDVEDLIHNFLVIMLEHSMRQKDGWKDIEATIHCAEWLSMVGGSSTGDQRVRREESLPIFKRRLLGSLLDFCARELQVQTQVIAAAAAGVAAECSSPQNARAEAENAAQLSVALVENAIVTLMLVEDHLRLQSKQSASGPVNGTLSPLTYVAPVSNLTNSLTMLGGGPKEAVGIPTPLPSDPGGVPLDVLTSMADQSRQVSATVMERLTAAVAAEPYQSVSCAFVSYGSCATDLSEGWKYRSRLWYGVGLPSKGAAFGGGGSGWDTWTHALETNANGIWIELSLIKKSVAMLQALLLDESGLGGGLGIGGGSGTGMGGMSALYQLLDSDQPFLCMLRMVLVSLREEDNGNDNMPTRNFNSDDMMSEVASQSGSWSSLDVSSRMSTRKARSALLWSVLSPVLNMPVSESKRQRVLVASCVLYSEVWHAIGKDRNPLRKNYLETIVPPFVAVLRRWRPLLAGIHELATPDGLNPLVDDQALSADALPIEAALSMISPGWAAAFASPPAALALAMIAAGASGGEAPTRGSATQLKRDGSLLERKTGRLHTFSSFQMPLEVSTKSPGIPKDKAAAKAAALAAARDLERSAKIGSGRGLSAVAMATSSQRRNMNDMERVNRWNMTEAMGTAWIECMQPFDTKSVYGKDFNALSVKFIAVLVASFALARNIQRLEIERHNQVDIITRHRRSTGSRAWRKLIHYLMEIKCLFGPAADHLCNPERVFWKLDFMESSSRMRRCLRRNYRGSDHFGAAADYEGDTGDKENQQLSTDPTKASVLSPEAIMIELIDEDDEHLNDDYVRNKDFDGEPSEADHSIVSEAGELSTEMSSVSRDALVVGSQEVAEDPSVVAPGYVPSEHDERIILELPSSIVRTLKVICGTFQRPDQLLKRTQLMERWARWEISNFEYLMQLNTLAGRTFNDITQYPVFPWIISDYRSNILDLSDPSSYRDLSKPVGALNPERLKKFQERYSSFDDPVIPKFHYGSHYSTAGTVLYYLARVEPFTTLSIQLQGGQFDHADRMFLDIAATWNGVLEEMSDVKELVPELFYFPEMLTNENSIDFGTTQLGDKIDSVRLPPWAESPVDFVHKHRMALESEHVSAHLHEWVNLIFGYKQRGKEAIAANNVFFYITYEGTIDIDKITDPVQRRATQDQIAYFGQTPSQILTVPHIRRKPLAEVLRLQTIFRNPRELKSYNVSMPERCNLPAAAIHASSDSVVIADLHAPAARIAHHKWQPNTPDGQGAPFLFQHGKAMANSAGGTLMRMFKGPTGPGSDEWQFPQAVAFATTGIRASSVIAITNDKDIITGGHVDNSIRLVSPAGAKTLEIATAHCAPVTCLALSSDSSYLVSGSRDATVLLWRIHRAVSSAISSNISETPLGGTPTSINSNTLATILADKNKRRRIEGPIHVLRGHLQEVLCCCVSSDLGIVVSCSRASDILIHSIRKGRMIQRLDGIEANAVCISSDGVLMAWNQSLHILSTFTVSGIPIARTKLTLSGTVSCMEVSFDGQTALVAVNACPDNTVADYNKKHGIEGLHQTSDDTKENALDVPSPSICFLDLYTLKVLHILKITGFDITALAVNHDNTNLLVSTLDKQLIIFTDPALSLKVVDHMLKIGWEGNGLSPLIK